MKSLKKLIAVMCVVLFLATPLVALSDEQERGSTVVEQSDTPSDTQQGGAPDTQVTSDVPGPAPEQPASGSEK